MAETANASSGVQDLIDRIRDQGVQAAAKEAERLLSNARKQAAEIISQAKSEADATHAKARAEIEAYETASIDALRLAARDTVLDLKSRVMSRFEEFVKRLVVSTTRDKDVVRDIVLVLAGHAAEEFVKDKDIQVRVSRSLLEGPGEPEFHEEGRRAILGLSSEMLREGVQLMSDDDIEGGARVKLVQDKLEIDLSDRAISRVISQRLLPRFKAILEGSE
jgi:V/A-type H+/Na+-transporting ATPase subunit E